MCSLKSQIIKVYTCAIAIIMRHIHVHAGLIFSVSITVNYILLLMLLVDCTLEHLLYLHALSHTVHSYTTSCRQDCRKLLKQVLILMQWLFIRTNSRDDGSDTW